MKILVDADSCPILVREVIIRAVKRVSVRAIFAANRNIPGLDDDLCIMELCPEGEGEADNRIVELAETGDLVITRDVPLADRLVEKSVFVIDDRGREFTKDNIKTFLSLRDFTVGLAESGTEIVRTANYTKKELKNFSDSFDKLLTKLTKQK